MRRRYTSQIDEESYLDMTPMLDIVFIMLIFFIVTASFVKESGIEVNRPGAQTAEVKAQGNILIAITAQNEIWMDRRRIDPAAVRANVERMRAENPGGSVVVQADETSHNGLLVRVIDQARLAGVDHVSVAATPAGH